MLSAFYEFTVLRVKSLFGLDANGRKRRLDGTDNESTDTPNAKIRRIEKPLGARNCSSFINHNLLTMSKFDRSHLVHRREHSEVECTWEKKSTEKENQFTRNSRFQAPDPDVVDLEDDLEDASHVKPCKHGFRKCEGEHVKSQVLGAQQVHRKTQPLHNEVVELVDDDEDVIFVKDSLRPKKNILSLTSRTNPIKFSERIKDYKWPTDEVLQVNREPKSGRNSSLFGLDRQHQNHAGVRVEKQRPQSVTKLDSPSVKARIRAGNLSRAAILRKSLPPPPTYFGVEPKLSSRWPCIDDKIKKKSSALELCSAIDEMKAYNHMLQQFTSDSAPKMKTRFDSQAFKLFEPQLKRNFSYAQLLKKKKGVEGSQVVETIDLSDDDRQEVGMLDEARGSWVVPKGVDVKRNRERVPIASGERIEADKRTSWAPPNAVEQMIKKSHVTNEEYLKNIVEKYTDEKNKLEMELEIEHVRKKLLSKRREKFESSLEERLKRYMKITEVILDDKEIAEEEEELPELTQEMLDTVHDALQKGRSSVLSQLGANTITGADIQTLVDSNWLNDEVINNYLEMLMQRGQSNEYPSVYCFNTFFYPKLNNSGYASIRRWTKKVDVFQKDILIVPLHLEIHWALSVVDFRQKTICYYDSMNGRKKNILQMIMKYLQDEKNDKKKENFDSSGWELKLVQDIPQQRNGYDCGVFACMFAEHLSRGVVSSSKGSSKCRRSYPPFPFSQDNMPYFRKRMIYEILSGKLLQ